MGSSIPQLAPLVKRRITPNARKATSHRVRQGRATVDGMDLRMPEVNGIEGIRRIKAHHPAGDRRFDDLRR